MTHDPFISLVARIRTAVGVGIPGREIHDALVGPGRATEEEFHLAYMAATIMDTPIDLDGIKAERRRSG